MSRRASAPRREILPDPRYHSELLAKFMNMIMDDGKKSKAEMIVYGALSQISTKKGTDEPLDVPDDAAQLPPTSGHAAAAATAMTLAVAATERPALFLSGREEPALPLPTRMQLRRPPREVIVLAE